MAVSLILVAAVLILVWLAPLIQQQWILWRATSAETQLRAVQRPSSAGSLQVDLAVVGVGRSLTITEVCVERRMAEELGLGPPAGFHEKPHRAAHDGDADGIAAVWDRQWVRYVGERELHRGDTASFSFAIERPSAVSGDLKFQYVELLGTGGIVGHEVVSVRLPSGSSSE